MYLCPNDSLSYLLLLSRLNGAGPESISPQVVFSNRLALPAVSANQSYVIGRSDYIRANRYLADADVFNIDATFTLRDTSNNVIGAGTGMAQYINKPLAADSVLTVASSSADIEVLLYASRGVSELYAYTGLRVQPVQPLSVSKSVGSVTLTIEAGSRLALIVNVLTPPTNPITVYATV